MSAVLAASVIPLAQAVIAQTTTTLKPDSGLSPNLTDWRLPTAVLAGIVILSSISPLLEGGRTLLVSAGDVFRLLTTLVYRRASREEVASRRRIATLLLENLDLLESDLHWRDKDFRDTRVTVESLDSFRRGRSSLGFRRFAQNVRTRSLSDALAHEKQKRILLQGGPGSGKSVAVRHYSRRILEQARRSRIKRSRLAIFVSLRDLYHAAATIDAEALQAYIEGQANPLGSHELSEYMRSRFLQDVAEGTVTLIFDSFDEIPAILGSTNIDRVVAPYIRAITALMGGGEATCVIASRDYKGPRVPGWARLQLVGLSHEEQLSFLKRGGMSPEQIETLEPLLVDPRVGFSTDLRNPLNLSLLAQYLSSHDDLPLRPTQLFEDYVDSRLSEAGAPAGREPGGASEVLTTALEDFAFDLMSRPELGLSGEEALLAARLQSLLIGSDPEEVVRLTLIAKESKLLVETRWSPAPRLAFGHRRVQEYLATRHVIRAPADLSLDELALNGRWRETAVTLLQVGKPADTADLLGRLYQLLINELTAAQNAGAFTWTPNAVHTLELLVASYGSDPRNLSDAIRDVAGQMVSLAWAEGEISDRKFALDCLPLAEPGIQLTLIDHAFSGDSSWLRTSALRECSTLHPLPDSVDRAIRRMLMSLLGEGRLSAEKRVLDVDLRRLYSGLTFIRIRRSLSLTSSVLLVLCLLRIGFDVIVDDSKGLFWLRYEILFWGLFPFGMFFLLLGSRPLTYGSRSRAMKVVERVLESGLGLRARTIDTETRAVTLLAVLLYLCTLYIVSGVVELISGGLVSGLLKATVLPVLSILALAWAPCLLLGVQRGWVGHRRLAVGLAVPIFRMVPAAFNFVRSYFWGLAREMLRALIPYSIAVATVVGVLWLLDHYAGAAGRMAVRAMGVLALLWVPFLLVVLLVRAIRSRRRVRAAVKSELPLTSSRFLESLIALRESSDAAEYLRLVRITRAEDARNLPRTLLRDLMRLAEHERNTSEGISADNVLNADVRRLVVAGLLDGALFQRWNIEVLEELGRLDEFLRER